MSAYCPQGGTERPKLVANPIQKYLPATGPSAQPRSVFQMVNRCFQILQGRAKDNWGSETDLLIAPDVGGIDWDKFGHGPRLIEAGETAPAAAVPKIQQWFSHAVCLRCAKRWT
jgi:hypothetical protein